VVLTLSAIEEDDTMKSPVRVKARSYIEGLLRYETILTAQLFLKIFEYITPLSKYLQTKGMDIIKAHAMVVTTQDSLKAISRDFQSVKAAEDAFVTWANERFKEQDKDTELTVEAVLPLKRRRKVKNMPGEMAHDETLSNAERGTCV